jgi:hypothetical protein
MQHQAQRLSHTIGQKAAQSLYYAFQQASRIGQPLNTHVTINFANTKCMPQNAVVAFAALRLTHFKRWAARRGFPATGGYAFENCRDETPIFTADEEHNIHVHWALHIPPKHAHPFQMELFKWVERVTGGIHAPETAIKITNPEPLALRRYVLKGATELWAPIYGATAEPQGLIVGGRRAGTTLNVGPTARKASDRALGIRRAMPQKRQQALSAASSSHAQG